MRIAERRYLYILKRLEAFELWTWRRMEKVSWTEHKTNEEVLETIGEESSLIGYAQLKADKRSASYTLLEENRC